MQDAFGVALEQWLRDGIPANPRTWLVSTGRNRAIDRMRRDPAIRIPRRRPRRRCTRGRRPADVPENAQSGVDDDLLRLIFTCCHPALAAEAQVALTLRTLCGLDRRRRSRAAFLVRPQTRWLNGSFGRQARSGSRESRTPCRSASSSRASRRPDRGLSRSSPKATLPPRATAAAARAFA